MRWGTGTVATVVRRLLLTLAVVSLLPLGVNAVRKLRTAGHSGLLVSAEEGGWRVRSEGVAAGRTGLKVGDLLLLIDGEEARTVTDPVRLLEAKEHEVTLLRDSTPLRVRTTPFAAPWDARYLFLVLVGTTFVLAS